MGAKALAEHVWTTRGSARPARRPHPTKRYRLSVTRWARLLKANFRAIGPSHWHGRGCRAAASRLASRSGAKRDAMALWCHATQHDMRAGGGCNRSSWHPWPTLAQSEPTRMASASQLRTLNRLRAEALGDLAIGIDAGEIDGPVWSVSDRGTAGAFRSSRADSGPQALPPARATVPPWLPAKSAHVSNLFACCALGPPARAAPCSCHHEACSARSAWPHPGKACPSVYAGRHIARRRLP